LLTEIYRGHVIAFNYGLVAGNVTLFEIGDNISLVSAPKSDEKLLLAGRDHNCSKQRYDLGMGSLLPRPHSLVDPIASTLVVLPAVSG